MNNLKFIERIEIGKSNFYKAFNGELEVDIDSYLELNFSNRFRSSIGVSYKQNLGKYCKIVGTKGEIKITDTWHGTPSVILVSGKKNKEIILNTRSNIYSYQTEFVSNCILNESKKLLFPGPSVKDSLRNIKILELWKN